MNATNGSNNYVPPKMWKDLTADEKIERMREIVKHYEYLLSEASRKVNQLRTEFVNHNHLDGKVVKPISEYNNETLGASKSMANPQDIENGNIYF